ncbi:hypothetical protein Y032_0360g3460 [Ancylostoma ceylanicum]|uniref:Uncharacterized protein n=1 Tax=Ancylostoma ceylanicum TaxID=53326 RepID=A0A016RWJ0_9BILA|nr:hypothetical protein Y032_0360g3460 [Ancylostoma ceylanicum]
MRKQLRETKLIDSSTVVNKEDSELGDEAMRQGALCLLVDSLRCVSAPHSRLSALRPAHTLPRQLLGTDGDFQMAAGARLMDPI